MGLLRALGRGARAAGERFNGSEMARGYAYGGLGGAALGAPIGAMMNPDDPATGAGAGMALGLLGGAGAGLAGGAAMKGARMAGEGIRGALTPDLQAIKQEALQYVRNSPQATQAVMQAQTPQEIAQIVDAVITRSRSRMTEGGF